MIAAFVLGNGVSRQAVDLATLFQCGTVYGCNAIYREFTPHVLISTDAPISAAIQNSGYSQNNVHYTRKPLPNLGARRINQKYFGYSSGPIAVAQAALDRHRAVYLVGFDMGPTRTGRFNNVYADTEFYKKSSSVPTYTGNWVRQLCTVMKDFPKVSFYRVMGDTTAEIKDLKNVANMTTVPMAVFLDRINNKKDF